MWRNETKDMLGSKDSMSLFNGNFGIPLKNGTLAVVPQILAHIALYNALDNPYIYFFDGWDILVFVY